MRARLATTSALAILTLLTYFEFPGHTYLTQDTQIYVPILEHLRDPSVLSRDTLVERPHVAFTIYDEVAIGLRSLTGADFSQVLAAEQLLFRGLGLWGIYLIASSALGSRRLALLVASLFALGAEVAGPAVLVTEYEPTPRAFAIPLLFLATGLVAHRRYLWAGVAASLAFLFHPPTVYPFWAVYLAVAIWPGKRHLLRGFWPLMCAFAILAAAAHAQTGIKEHQTFFWRIDPGLEALQRMRAPYNWVSLWWRDQWAQYCLLASICAAAIWRVHRLLEPELRAFLVGLAGIGMLSVPVSYLFLDVLKWGLIPQVQPARALLFVTAVAVLGASVAACHAARQKRWAEAFAWFLFVILIPMHARIDSLPGPSLVTVAVALALLACVGAGSVRFATPFAAVAPFFCIPLFAHIRNYPRVDTPDLHALSSWARSATARDAVFLFPGPHKSLVPGFFRSEALRPVYVDWKGGGQVNYLPEFGQEWWSRYRETMLKPFTPACLPRYAQLGISYVVLPRPIGRPAVFSNTEFAVYRTAP